MGLSKSLLRSYALDRREISLAVAAGDLSLCAGELQYFQTFITKPFAISHGELIPGRKNYKSFLNKIKILSEGFFRVPGGSDGDGKEYDRGYPSASNVAIENITGELKK